MRDLSILETIWILAGVIAIVLSGVWVMLRRTFRGGINDKTLSNLVDKIDILPSAERENEIVDIKSEIVVIYSRLDSIEMSLVRINFTLEVIKSWIMKQDITMIDLFSVGSPIRKNSPKALNSLGHEIIRIIDGMKFLEDNKVFLFDLIDKEMPKTALDVESSAYSVCFISTRNDIFNAMKNCIYTALPIKVKNKKGEDVDFSIDLYYACYVLSVPLRDMYLSEHPTLLDQLL